MTINVSQAVYMLSQAVGFEERNQLGGGRVGGLFGVDVEIADDQQLTRR